MEIIVKWLTLVDMILVAYERTYKKRFLVKPSLAFLRMITPEMYMCQLNVF